MRSENPGAVVTAALPRLEPLRYVRTDALLENRNFSLAVTIQSQRADHYDTVILSAAKDLAWVAIQSQ
ncbi:MAG: hypothetical protein ACJ8DI_11530 [Ktedonobacteraceae bacterium]